MSRKNNNSRIEDKVEEDTWMWGKSTNYEKA
jgi:hypothetical protein